MSQPSEASVEEILESIKKVIARDNRDDAIATRRRREVDGVVQKRPKAETEAAPKAEIAPEPTALTADETNAEVDAEAEVLDLAEMQFAEDIDGPTADNDSVAALEDAEDALTTEEARATMRENLEALAMIAQPSAPPQIVRSGETSLEGLTRELLRPMLSEWLDTNLPDMVESLVKEEIARIARKDS
ncbi:MAG: DUF2497 domain-containing protein [Erythrobacter sp.]